MTKAYVSLGSNLDNPVERIDAAFRAIAGLAETTLIRRSPLYRNPAVGPGSQPDFVNAVAELATDLDPQSLLAALKSIESAQGREPSEMRWVPRVMDLDILLYGDCEIEDDGLTVPHPELPNRRFVLKPLWDIAPDIEVPGQGPLRELLERAPAHELKQIESGNPASGPQQAR